MIVWRKFFEQNAFSDMCFQTGKKFYHPKGGSKCRCGW